MNNIKKHKRLIAAIVVILLAVLVEIFANRSAWGHAYDLDITDHMYISESAGQEEYQVIFSAPKGLYIQMLTEFQHLPIIFIAIQTAVFFDQ